MVSRNRRWSELSPGARVAVVAGALVELTLSLAAGRDLARRPRDEVRGPKWVWSLLLVVQPVGPVAYLLAGRRRRATVELVVAT